MSPSHDYSTLKDKPIGSSFMRSHHITDGPSVDLDHTSSDRHVVYPNLRNCAIMRDNDVASDGSNGTRDDEGC